MSNLISQKKIKLRYFEKSIRFPIGILFLILFILILIEQYYADVNFVVEEQIFTVNQWIVLGSGFLLLFLLESIEWIMYPNQPFFWLAVLLTGIRIIAIYAIFLVIPTALATYLIGYLLFTICFYVNSILMMVLLLMFIYFHYNFFSLHAYTGKMDLKYVLEVSILFAVYVMALIIKWDDRIRIRNQSMYRQLEKYATNSITHGKQEERDRISRDLHDSLGHQLVAVNIQLQKAVAYQEIDQSESQKAIETAQNSTNEAIKELRQTIKNLREFEEGFHLEEDLDQTVEQVRKNGLNLVYTRNGSSAGFPELTLLTMKQIIQEGLTNIQKHAQASQASLKIQFQRRRIQVLIEDDGIGFNPKKVDKDGHYGLQGMQERLDIVGGKMRIQSKAGEGTKMIIHLPKEIYG